MKTAIYSIYLALIVVLSACSDNHPVSTQNELEELPGVPIVKTEKYGSFRVLMLGDSYCGTISQDQQIQFDCGELAGTYAYEEHGKRDGRCVVSRTKDRVAATILKPPAGSKSDYYPINVFSPNLVIKEEELKTIAFQIEEAVLRK